MNKIITTEQIKAILDAFYQANAGVQMYTNLQNFLNELPDVPETPTLKK